MARRPVPLPARLTAAATKKDLTVRQRPVPAAEWQAEAWDYYDEIPEVKESVTYLGNQIAKVRLFAGWRDPLDPTADPVPVGESPLGALAAAADAEVARLDLVEGGQPELLRALTMNLEVPGECYIVGHGARTDTIEGRVVDVPERWAVASTDEVLVKDGKFSVVDDDYPRGRPLDPELDTLIRVWQRHPRRRGQADSPMRALITDCRVLMMLLRLELAETRSRMSAGAFTLPNELSYGPADETDPDDGDGVVEDPFLADLEATIMDPIDNPEDGSSVVPMVIRGPAEFLRPDVLRHITFERTPFSEIDDRIDARIMRIARGMNLPVEKVMGHQQTTFANAAQVDIDEFDDYERPRVEQICESLTAGFLRPNLLDTFPSEAERVRQVVVWYDPSALLEPPDLAAAADGAHDRLVISNEAYRRVKGFTEDDAPDDAEVEARSSRSKDADSGAGPVVAAVPASVEPGDALMQIDRDLRTRLLVAANAAAERAIERAANRIRGKARGEVRDVVRASGVADAVAKFGRDVVLADAGDVMDGAWDTLEAQFRSWAATAQADAIDVASRVASGFSTAERQALKLRQAADLDEAWGWLREALDGLAERQLFDPSPGLAALGELDPTLRIPPGPVRASISIAGGAPPAVTTRDGADAWVMLTDGGTRPVGGIGTGDLLRESLSSHGVGTEAYRWVYGPAARSAPFEPHVRLDGVVFRNFDDPVLLNSGSFPAFSHYLPGDHAGCLCDFAPVLLPTDTGFGSR